MSSVSWRFSRVKIASVSIESLAKYPMLLILRTASPDQTQAKERGVGNVPAAAILNGP
jgi:hypothetical protein